MTFGADFYNKELQKRQSNLSKRDEIAEGQNDYKTNFN